MKLMEFIEKYKILIAITILLIYFSATANDIYKKESFMGMGPGTYKIVQTGGLAAIGATILKFMGPWGLGIGAVLLLGPMIWTNWANLFHPATQTIPSWIYIAGFGILAIYILKRK